MSTKKKLGQFYTTNYQYIFSGMEVPKNKIIIEPFVGKGDLLKFLEPETKVECYDIEPKYDLAIQMDTLLNPPNYTGKYVLTNPPYLARNKSKDKELFSKYNTNDLYKCFLLSIISDKPDGGIIIIPLNFWCSIRVSDINLRKKFVEAFDILRINIFEEKVFSDTSYTVCSVQFSLRKDTDNSTIYVKIYPSNKEFHTFLDKDNNYTFGGEIYSLPQNNNYTIDRLTRKNSDTEFTTNIFVKCIDDNSEKKLGLSIAPVYVDNTANLSARSFATLVISPKLSQLQQENLVKKFNNFMDEKRELYHSLFLTNYRESKDIARKRISFSLVYTIIKYLLL